ncbi:MAG: glutamine amidotransferase-related protein, partial [Gibbsiella quercinecans]|uniref:glutamine amidotransferase-related protein n=1 Tax=Gibbsiella quercinecans TaxID=929813 RepID=UPI003F314898
ERLTGQTLAAPITPATLLGQRQDRVVPLGPSQLAHFPALARRLQRGGVDYELVHIEQQNGRFGFSRLLAGHWRQDRFGRWRQGDDTGVPEAALRIALIGRWQDQQDAYPATLAALGDAADALGLPLEVVCLAPQEIADQAGAQARLAGFSGVLLPGGSAMANVPGQIQAAHYTLAHAIPTLGLCLGMQTMATAVAQQMLGSTQANLAEADPSAAIKTFTPLHDAAGLPLHRLGAQPLCCRPGSLMHGVLGERYTVRYNHRYQLNPALKAGLEQQGLCISATDASGAVADGIEFTRHPFFLGVQGHPELSSREGQAHPLLMAFLRAAARQR